MTDKTGAIGPHGKPLGWKPKLGLLPQIPDRPALMLSTLGVAPVALPVPPAVVRNIELDPDTDMLGNDVWGNCPFVALERNRRICALAFGAKITWLTAQQVIDNYKAYTGITSPPGPGAVMQLALEWTQKHPERWGGNKLLFFARLPHAQLATRQAVSEFGSIITCEVIRAAQEYPSKDWAHTTTPELGAHATPGGSYDALHLFLKTWGYVVTVEPSFFTSDIDEIDVLVWDFMWTGLTYDRQVALIADIQSLTGNKWTGPAPIIPAPVPTGGNVVIKQYFPSAVFSIVGTIHGQKLNEMTGALTAGTTLTAAKPSSASAVARVTVNGADFGLVVNGTFAGQLIPWALLTWQSGHEPIGPYKP